MVICRKENQSPCHFPEYFSRFSSIKDKVDQPGVLGRSFSRKSVTTSKFFDSAIPLSMTEAMTSSTWLSFRFRSSDLDFLTTAGVWIGQKDMEHYRTLSNGVYGKFNIITTGAKNNGKMEYLVR